MPLNRRAAQEQIDLIIIVPVAPQILDTSERRLAVSDRGVHVMLFAVLVHAEALKGQIPAGTKVRLDRAWQEQRGLHVEIADAVLHHAQFNGNDTGYLNSAAEGDLPVALAEMQVSDAELCAWNVHWQKCTRTPGEIFDITVLFEFELERQSCGRQAKDPYTTMLRTSRNSPGSFFANFLFHGVVSRASVNILRLGRLGDDTLEIRGAYKFGFPSIPFGKDFSGRSTAQDARMDQAWKPDVRNVS